MQNLVDDDRHRAERGNGQRDGGQSVEPRREIGAHGEDS
jgi:hypothetical protein